jgi:hypothetical protein
MQRKTTTTKRESLTMVYVLHKFKHYLLGNKFVFYINHMALPYLVKKPQLSSQIARWLLLFLEYVFSVMYKPRCFHVMAMFSRNFLMLSKIRGCLIELLMHNYLYFNWNGYRKCICTSLLEIFQKDIPWNNQRN